MAEPVTWDLLIHPFFSLGYPPGSPFKPLDPALKRRLMRNAEVLDGIWRRRILFLSSHRARGLIIINPAFPQLELVGLGKDQEKMARRGRGMSEGLADFAIRHLGQPNCIIAPSGVGVKVSLAHVVSEKRLLAGNSVGAAMGEYNDVCVSDGAKIFKNLTGQKMRVAASKGMNSFGGPRRSDLAEFALKNYKKARRLEKMAGAGAKRALR